jgi:hypothetical protein
MREQVARARGVQRERLGRDNHRLNSRMTTASRSSVSREAHGDSTLPRDVTLRAL